MGFWSKVKELFKGDTAPPRAIPKAVVPNPFAPVIPPAIHKTLPTNPLLPPPSDDPLIINPIETDAPEWWWDTKRKMWIPDKDLEPDDYERWRKSPPK